MTKDDASQNRGRQAIPLTDQQIADLYNSGATLREIVADHHCGKDVVRRVLQGMGVPLRRTGPAVGRRRRELALTDEEIAKRYKGGATLRQVAAEAKCSQSTVVVRLDEQHVRRRRPVWL